MLPTDAADTCVGLDQRKLRVKRSVDILLSVLALAFLSPVLAIAALGVRLSGPGPVLFRQERHGLMGRPFVMYKFRTVHHDKCDAAGISQLRAGDPRVTAFGRLLRVTSVDELPQLINIIKGEMSLVGPRPHPIGILAAGRPYEELVPHYHRRHAVKPGLTGLAQCNGYRGPTDDARRARARIEHDLRYIEIQSLGLDLRIMARTLRVVLAGS